MRKTLVLSLFLQVDEDEDDHNMCPGLLDRCFIHRLGVAQQGLHRQRLRLAPGLLRGRLQPNHKLSRTKNWKQKSVSKLISFRNYYNNLIIENAQPHIHQKVPYFREKKTCEYL